MKHPKQRDVLDGLTAQGCLTLIAFIMVITVLGEWFFGL